MSTILILVAYLLGSIPFAFVLARKLGGVDLRAAGSRNLGAANVLRSTRPSVAALVVLLDIGKGAAAVTVARAAGAGDAGAASAALAAIVGHIYPVWLRLRGGKGVAVACGAFSVLAPVAAAVATAVFIVVVWTTRYVSLGSILATISLAPLADAAGAPRPVMIAGAAAAALILFRHRTNLLRLARGTERRLGERA